MKLTPEQKQEFINTNLEAFFNSPKTGTEEYKTQFNTKTLDEQYAIVLRWFKYNEKKTLGPAPKRATKTSREQDIITDLMHGSKVEVNTELAELLITQFTTAIETLNNIIVENKQRAKDELKAQIEDLKKQLKELDK